MTQSLSFVAGCNAITYCNSHPVFIDVEKDTLGMSPESLESFLLNNSEIRERMESVGIKKQIELLLHVYQHMYMDFLAELMKLRKFVKNLILLLLRMQQSHWVAFIKKVISAHILSCQYSAFNGNKIITTGGGGMVVTNNAKLAERIKHLTTTAKVPHKWEFNHDDIGFNYRMPNINAALGIAQLEQINFFGK